MARHIARSMARSTLQHNKHGTMHGKIKLAWQETWQDSWQDALQEIRGWQDAWQETWQEKAVIAKGTARNMARPSLHGKYHEKDAGLARCIARARNKCMANTAARHEATQTEHCCTTTSMTST